jgi:hypothetical protein
LDHRRFEFFFLGQNSCPANYSSQMRFADPVTCSQYSQCVDGHLEQRACSNNFLFDRITKTCKPFEQAECHGNKPDSFLQTTTISSCELTERCFIRCKSWIFRCI